MNFNSTVKGSSLEGFYPAGWDFDKIDACVDAPEKITERQAHWNDGFNPVKCESLGEFETYMGHEIAMQIKLAKEKGEKIAFILPVGPMGMYKWVVYFLQEWNVSCEHVYTFNMDEWADAEGNTLAPDNTGAFQYAMEQALFNPLSVSGDYNVAIGVKANLAKEVILYRPGNANLTTVDGQDSIDVRDLVATLKASEGIALGSKAAARGADINGDNLTITNAANALCLMTDYCGHGHVSIEDIHFNGISAMGVARPIELTENSEAYIRNITIENFYVEAFAGAWMESCHEGHVSDITIRNSTFKTVESPVVLNQNLRRIRGEYTIFASNIKNLTLDNVRFDADKHVMDDWQGTLKTDECINLIVD